MLGLARMQIYTVLSEAEAAAVQGLVGAPRCVLESEHIRWVLECRGAQGLITITIIWILIKILEKEY